MGRVLNNAQVKNCLYTGNTVEAASYKGAIVGGIGYCTLTNNYYTSISLGGVGGESSSADQDGARQARIVTLGDDVALVGDETAYDVSGLTAIGTNALSYDDGNATTLYSGEGQTLTFIHSDVPSTGYVWDGFSATGGGTFTGNTLTMPADNTTVSATTRDVWGITSGATGVEAHPYMISDTTGLNLLARNVNGTDGYTANGFSGTFFKLANNITYSHVGLGSTESNYTAIGGYFNGGNRYFWGTFDGDNDTISGIRIYKGGTTDADGYQGLFGNVVEGTIKNVTLTDAVITGNQFVGGIVGYISMNAGVGGNIENCHVTSSVTLHAVVGNASFHGGIVGDFDGDTLSGCSSAATLSYASDLTGCTEYGGLVGYLHGHLQNCLVLGATVSGTDMVGAVVGYKDDGYTCTANYYRGCTVNGSTNAINVGTGNNGDIAGIRSLHTLTLGTDITATGAIETKVIGDTTYYASASTVTLSTTVPTGYHFDSISATAGTLSGNTNPCTLTFTPAADVTATAVFTPITYNITYNLSGGSASNPATYNIETSTFTLVNPTRIGYAFAGWTGTDLADTTITVTIAQGSTGDRSYTATWIDVWGIAGGANGNQETPYIITTTQGLDLLATLVNSGRQFNNIYFCLGADITYTHTTDWDDASSTENNYTAIGCNINNYFNGTFDGQGHTVSGIRIYSGDYKGLFGQVNFSYCTIKNITLSDTRITGKITVGGIVGCISNGTVENCHVTQTVAIHAAVSDAYNHGGIAGLNYGTVRGCSSAATLTIASNINYCLRYGGIVGYCYNNGTVENCLALGANVSGSSNVGAIAGKNDGTITNCHYRNCSVNAVAQNDIYTVAPGTDITLSPAAADTTTYPYNGIEVYGSALYYGGTLYAADIVSLTLSDTYTGSDPHYGFKASSGTISGTANPYSLTLAGADVVVNAITCADDTIGPAFTIRPFNDTTLCVDPDGSYVNTVNRIAALVSPADLSDNYTTANAITVTSLINFAPKEDQNDGYETDTDPREVTYGKRTYSQVWTATDACGNNTREKLYIHLYPLATIRIDSLGTQTITYGEDIRDVLIHHYYSALALSPQNSGVNLNNNDTTGTLRGMPDSAGTFNYTLTATSWHDCNTVDTTVTIYVNPRPITITAASATKKYDGTPLTSNNYMCTLTAPFSDINNRILVNNDSIASVTLTGSQTAVGSCAVTPSNVAITIATETTADKNPSYDITYVPGTLTVIENDTLITVTAGSGNKVYDGTPLTMTAHEDFTVTGLPAGFTWTATADGIVTNVIPGVGEKAVNAVTSFHIFDANSVDVTAYFTNIHRVSGTLAITPKPLTITAASDTKEYDGIALTNSNYTSSALVTGETLESVTVTGIQTQVGSSDNVPSAAVIMNDNDNVNDNYNITYINGTLTVTQKPLTITAGSDTIVYNGMWLRNKTYTHSALATGDSLWSVTIKDSVLYGESPNVPRDAVIKNGAGDTVTNSYNINYVNGNLKIKQKKLTITAGSASKVYDGTVLTCYTFTDTGLVRNDYISSVTMESNLTWADTIDNDISTPCIKNPDINDTIVTNCYEIKYVKGKLMVAKKPITITACSASKPYDGTELTCDSFTHTELVEGDSIWSVSFVGSQTEVGSSDNVPSEADIQNSSQVKVSANYAITYVPGTLTVTPGIFAGAGGWQAISAPVHDEGETYWTPASALTTGAYDLFRYDEPTATWQNYKSSSFVLDRGRGYIYRRPSELAIPFGGNYNSGSFTTSLSYTPAAGDLKGFHLVGNPYQMAIYKGTNVGCSAGSVATGYYELLTDGTWLAHLDSDPIAVGQGFLVQATSDATTLSFNDNPGSKGKESDLNNQIVMTFTVSDGEHSDVAYALFNFEFGNSNFEIHNSQLTSGLRKITHLNDDIPSLGVSVRNQRFAIATLASNTRSFDLAFSGKAGSYTLTVDPKDPKDLKDLSYCHLIDRLTGKDIDLLRQPTYTFTHSHNNAFSPRFLIKLSPSAVEDANTPFAYQEGDHLVIDGKGVLHVFDMLGREVFRYKIQNSHFTIHNSKFPATGVYILKLNNNTQKIVIR